MLFGLCGPGSEEEGEWIERVRHCHCRDWLVWWHDNYVPVFHG
jgi:hypothetical protein